MQSKTEEIPLGKSLQNLVKAVSGNHTVELYFDDSKLVNAITYAGGNNFAETDLQGNSVITALLAISSSIDGLADAIREKKK